MKGARLRIQGRVQGVGFRPTVWRLARQLQLSGRVANDVGGVIIELPDTAAAHTLAEAIRRNCPPLARIDSITVSEADGLQPFDGFTITKSNSAAGFRPTDVAPDAAICADCLADLNGRQPRRAGYWLTNCTHCGPRFSITHTLPYDRANTSMDVFPMCVECEAEYSNPADRRYHAQPISCAECGPLYTHTPRQAAQAIARGEIIMLKGTGGYALMCDARREEVLQRLRVLKHRPRKPFAVMGASADVLPVELSTPELEALQSWRAPIVVATLKSQSTLPCSLAPGLDSLGVMLPSMGFHHALMGALPKGALTVVTSANFPGCPIIADDEEARRYAEANGLMCIGYNRIIHNRVDDSVVRLLCDGIRPLRRARGYTPDPLSGVAGRDLTGTVAFGADIVGGIAIGRSDDIIPGQFLGSLHTEGGEDFLRESVANMLKLYRIDHVGHVVVDCHPGYTSGRIGRALAESWGAEVTEVQHHHAHALAVMAEHRINEKTPALVLDGTGWGPDGTVWGSELLWCDRHGFERLDHGPYLKMPGGDAAAREPWRMAASLAHYVGAPTLPDALEKRFSGALPALRSMMERNINSPLTSGAGRLWDAVAALAGLVFENSYEAEAPLLLEGACAHSLPSGYSPHDFDELLHDIHKESICGKDAAQLAMMLHEGYSAVWARKIIALGFERVILAGGVMANGRLLSFLTGALEAKGITVLHPIALPPGDGAIAAGQLYAL